MEAGSTVKPWVPKNLGWKLAALALSIMLWIAMSAEPDLVTARAVPILYRNLASQFLMTGDVPETVRVEIRGSASQLSSSSLADTVALFDLGVIDAAGERTFTLSNDNLNLPRGVTFLRAMPSQLRLRIARLALKEVPIEVRVTGNVAPQYHLASRTAIPGTLRITGSEDRINAVHSVETDAIDVNGLTQSVERRVNAFITDSELRFEATPIVTVKLTIEKTGN
jgi:YbbR domain-containing protein